MMVCSLEMLVSCSLSTIGAEAPCGGLCFVDRIPAVHLISVWIILFLLYFYSPTGFHNTLNFWSLLVLTFVLAVFTAISSGPLISWRFAFCIFTCFSVCTPTVLMVLGPRMPRIQCYLYLMSLQFIYSCVLILLAFTGLVLFNAPLLLSVICTPNTSCMASNV